MNGALHVPPSQEREGVAGVHGESRILRFYVLPFSSVVVLDLEGRDWLAEQKGPGAEI